MQNTIRTPTLKEEKFETPASLNKQRTENTLLPNLKLVF